MSGKMTQSNNDHAGEPLLYKDHSLVREYPVMEIAMLAAGCRGDTREARISDAVELLALVERYAISGKGTRQSIRDRREHKSSIAGGRAKVERALNQRFQKAVEIRGVSDRDRKSGKIELTSLVGLAYEAATGGKADSSEAMRRYNDWAREEAHEQSVTVRAFKADFSSGSKPALVQDDQAASILAMRFIAYLEKSPKREPTKIIQSTKPETKGQIVSPKTRGSDIADGTEKGASKSGKPRKRGQYKPKQASTAAEHEDSRRGSRTRTNGERPD